MRSTEPQKSAMGRKLTLAGSCNMAGKVTLRSFRPCGHEPLKNGLMQWAFELHSANVSLHPANSTLKGLETIEPYPDTLSNRRPFYEFDFAAFGGGVENSDAIPMRT